MEWSSEEIRNLLLYVKEVKELNEDLSAKMIMMQAKLENEESKVRLLKWKLNELLYEKKYTDNNTTELG